MLDKIKKFYSTHIIRKAVLTFFVVAVIVGVIAMLPVIGVSRAELPASEPSVLEESSDVLAKDAGEVLLAENGNRQLYINTENMVVSVKNLQNGQVWKSAVDNSADVMDTALFYITYLGEDDITYEWDSYSYCTALGSYELYRIEDGVRLEMDLSQGESGAFYEYMPKKMSIERYENFFLAGLEGLFADGILEEEKYNTYVSTLGLLYKLSKKDNCYVISYTGTPPASAVKQMIEVTKLLSYTQDMLVSDSAEFGIVVAFAEPAEFSMTMELTLENGELRVRIPTDRIVSKNDFYVMQNIDVLPNFGAVHYEQSAFGGFMLVPDGSGAIMELNTGNTDVVEYTRPIYNNDYAKDYYWQPEYSQELTMPVFGMSIAEEDQSSEGFLAVIENGAETSYIHTKLATDESGGSSINKIYTSFDTVQFTKVKVYGAYSSETTGYLVATDMLNVDYSLRYIFLEEEAGYYKMAESYRDYLVKNDPNVGALSYENEGKVYLEVIGALTLTERFLGIPYDSVTTMTTYTQLRDMLEDIGSDRLSVSYKGVFNEGMSNSMYDGADLVKANGSSEELEELRSYAREKGIDLYLGTSMSRVYTDSAEFMTMLHAAKDFADIKIEQYNYASMLGILSGFVSNAAESYYTLSAEYLDYAADSFLAEAEEYDSLFVDDLANIYYADYDNSDMIDVYASNRVLDGVLQKLSAKKLALNNPWMSKIGYAELATDIARESSHYRTFAASVPFRQLVLNGLVPYTTETVNLSSLSTDYFVLQAAELGAYPKFTVSWEKEDMLKNSDYTGFYCVSYEKLKDRIKSVSDECEALWEEIGTTEIAGHTIVGENVFKTEYANGVSVIVNYNRYPVTLEDETVIEAEEYMIIK